VGLEDPRERWDSRYDDDPPWHELCVDEISLTHDQPDGDGVHADVHEFVARFCATDWHARQNTPEPM
jgi:hypothetical protein